MRSQASTPKSVQPKTLGGDMLADVYIAPEVREVIALHPYLDDPSFRKLSVATQFSRQAEVLHSAHAAGDRRIRFQVMCWWPAAAGISVDELLSTPFSMDDASLTLAREYGFASWAEVEALGEAMPDASFEAALDAMLAGDIGALTAILHRDQALIKARTIYGHGSTLLHYLGSNGVESHRQVVPLNAAVIAALLIERGADRQSKATMYGGGQTACDLASTSAHPYKAGIADDLLRVLGSQQ